MKHECNAIQYWTLSCCIVSRYLDMHLHSDIYRPLRRLHSERDGVSNHQPHDCLPNRLFRRRSKKIAKLRVTDLCEGNSPVTGEFPTQRARNTENISIWWRHHTLSWPCNRNFSLWSNRISLSYIINSMVAVDTVTQGAMVQREQWCSYPGSFQFQITRFNKNYPKDFCPKCLYSASPKVRSWQIGKLYCVIWSSNCIGFTDKTLWYM